MASFEICKSGTQYRWRYKAGNGEIVATGESYTTKAAAQKGIESIKRDAASATVKDLT